MRQHQCGSVRLGELRSLCAGENLDPCERFGNRDGKRAMDDHTDTHGPTIDPPWSGTDRSWSLASAGARDDVLWSSPTPHGMTDEWEIVVAGEVWTMVVPVESSEQRAEPRFAAAANLLWMQWREGSAYLGRSSTLINVSRSGALIVARVLLRERQSVRIFLEEAEEAVGVDATVLGVVEGLRGKHLIRLGFESPCPAAFFRAAAFGFESWLARDEPKL